MNFLIQIVTVSFTMAADLQAAREEKKKYLFFNVFFLVQRGMWDLSSPTRDQTYTLCIERPSLNHWTTREVSNLWHLLSCKCLFASFTQPSPCVCVCVCVCVFVHVCPNSPFYKITVMLD
ncbi:unnamed protein product [Rangifer tarandus platyrhynchus]|uniref:Uncharacterized protein n=1 Tax=Rangifer tarandus platyrhynchus TaxID=3082113 RepID=A0AC59ZIJ1_RANTA